MEKETRSILDYKSICEIFNAVCEEDVIEIEMTGITLEELDRLKLIASEYLYEISFIGKKKDYIVIQLENYNEG